MDAHLAQLGPNHSVGAGQIDVTLAGQGNAAWGKQFGFVEALHYFRQFFFWHLLGGRRERRKLVSLRILKVCLMNLRSCSGSDEWLFKSRSNCDDLLNVASSQLNNDSNLSPINIKFSASVKVKKFSRETQHFTARQEKFKTTPMKVKVFKWNENI